MNNRTAIIDYGVGNLFSIKSSLRAIGAQAIVTADPDLIADSERMILPGVGAFADAAQKLRDAGLDKVICREASDGKPLLGICLGMQLLLEKSYEYGEHPGLGLIHGAVKPIRGVIPSELKIPHIGWNELHFPVDKPRSRIFRSIQENDFVYFVHSYYAADCENAVIATTEYGAQLTAAVQNRNVYGVQFHPEKSGEIGLSILREFVSLTKEDAI